ncbi:MAG: AEC family transporter [Alphaproteobacteria bacterium]|nr:AEC family transporter [Alphaproteobacteria bacterium]
MIDIIDALIPTFLVIAIGWAMRQSGFPGEAFWPNLERVTYFVIFPCFLFETLITGQVDPGELAPMTFGLLTGVFVMAGLVFAARLALPMPGPQFSSVFQGAVRWNGFVALAVIAPLFGEPGMRLAAIGFGVLVPIANLLSVYVVTRYASDTPVKWDALARSLAMNPLLWACALGIAAQALGLSIPVALETTVATIGKAAVPLGLLAVGASLDLAAARASGSAVALTCTLRLLVMPGIMWASLTLWGIEGIGRDIAVVFGATPTATSAYILARQLGGDAVLMANLVTATTLGAIATMPVVLYFFL